MAWAEKLPSGRWRGSYRTKDGKIKSAGTFKSKREATQEATVIEKEASSKGWKDPKSLSKNNLTWGEWCKEWAAVRRIEPNTEASQVTLINKHILPKWSSWVLGDINRHEVQKWVTELSSGVTSFNKPLKAASVIKIVGIFSASLAAAIKAEILEVNVAHKADLPKVVPSKDRWLSHEEEALIMGQLHTAQDRAIVAVLTGTGMRWGEAMGWHHFRTNEKIGVMQVVEVWDKTAREIKPYPKGIHTRTVPVPAYVWEALEEASITSGKTCGHPHREGACRSSLVLSEPGKMVDLDNWRKRVWEKAVKNAGVEHVTVHDLRHTYASRLVQAGIPMTEIGRLLGHQAENVTRRYAHLAAVPEQRILDALKAPEEWR